MQENANQFINRLIGFSLGPIISAAIGFIMTPITSWLIVPEEFGKAAMYSTALSFSSLVVFLGTDQAFLRDYHSENNKNNLLWNYILPPIIFSLILSSLFLIKSKEISNILFADFNQLIMIVTAISIPLLVLQRFNLLIIRMQEKARLYSLITVLVKLIDLILLILLLLFFERSFRSIVIAQFLTTVIITIIVSMINQKILLKKPKFNKNLMKKGLKYGIPLIPSAIFAWGLYSADNISLRAWSNFTEIGLYSAATKITMFLTIIKTSFSTFWVPTYFRWHENGEAKHKFIKVSQLVSTALFIIFCLVVIFKDIIILVFDQRYHEAIFIVPFLLFFSLLYTISETTNMGIFLSRKTFYSMLATGLALVINFSGNYFLIPKMGGIGASISTAFAFLAYFWVNTLASRRLWYKFEIKFYVVNLLLLFILAGISVFYHNTIIELLMFGLIIIYNHNHVKHLAELAFGQLKLLTHKMKW